MAFDSSRAERELELPKRPLRESLADAVAWLAAEGRIARDLTKESVQAGYPQDDRDWGVDRIGR
jgi:hypothetical protein